MFRIDVGYVVVVDRKQSDVDDARGFDVRAQLYRFAAKVNSTRNDFDFDVGGARESLKTKRCRSVVRRHDRATARMETESAPSFS